MGRLACAWWILAIAATGCLGPDRHRCAAAEDCPGGQCEANGFCSFAGATCQEYGNGAGSLSHQCVEDARVIDASTDAPTDTSVDADPDPDRDGVPTQSDNCPTVANPSQTDEDNDRAGDACDNCPHLSNSTQANGDGDQLGDACDATMMMGQPPSRLLLFDGFTTPDVGGMPTGWTIVNGSWSVVGGQLAIGNSMMVAARAWRPLPLADADQRVNIVMRGTALGVTPPTIFGVLAPVDFPAATGDGCGIRQSTVGGPGDVVRLSVAPSSINGTALASLPSLPPIPAEVKYTRLATAATCDIVGVSRLGGTFVGADSPLDRIGIAARGVELRIDWIVAYTD